MHQGVVPFQDWLTEHLPALEQNPRLREDNTVIARHLLPVFESDPNAWRAVRYLNGWPPVAFAEYFDSWRSATPSELRQVVSNIELALQED